MKVLADPGSGFPEAEWRVLFRQQSAKLVQSLRDAAEEHLRQQELLVDDLLEKAKDNTTRARQREWCEKALPSPELPLAPKEFVTVPKELTVEEVPFLEEIPVGTNSPGVGRPQSKSTTGTPTMKTSKSGLQSYMDSEMGDLTAGVMSVTQLNMTSDVAATYLQRFKAIKKALEEPLRSGRLANIVNSTQFEIVTFIVIGTYSAFAIWMTNNLLDNPEILESESVLWAETCFLVFFVTELMVKLIVHRLYFFCNDDMGWNWLDFFIIVFSLVDFGLNAFTTKGPVLQDVNYVRVLRALRISKSLRIIRAVRFVTELRVLMMCIVTSFSVLFWCVVLLLLIQAGVSTALVQLVAEHVHEERAKGVSEEDLQPLIEGFGSVQASMIRLFQSTTGGIDWGSVLKLMNRTGWVATLIFGLYLLFFFIAAWNIITSLFIEKAMKLAQPDIESQMLAKHKEELQNSTEIIKLLEDTDTGRSGTISLQQFQQYMTIPRFRHFFEFRDLEIKDAEMFFRLLSAISDSDDVPYRTFANGCLRMKGYASVLDVQSLRIELKTTYLHQNQLFSQLSEELGVIADQLENRKDVPPLDPHEETMIRDLMLRKELNSFKNQLEQRKDVQEQPAVVVDLSREELLEDLPQAPRELPLQPTTGETACYKQVIVRQPVIQEPPPPPPRAQPPVTYVHAGRDAPKGAGVHVGLEAAVGRLPAPPQELVNDRVKGLFEASSGDLTCEQTMTSVTSTFYC